MEKLSVIWLGTICVVIWLRLGGLCVAAVGDEFWDNRQHAKGAVLAFAMQGTDLLIGGDFTQIGGLAASNIARWDGTNWFPVGAGVNGRVRGLAVHGKDVYACGSFDRAGDVSVSNVARWDGTSWSALGSLPLSWPIRAIAVSSDGNEVFAGQEVLGTAGGKYIFKWDGTEWTALGGGIYYNDALSTPVGAILVDGNDVYVGGEFTNVGGVDASDLARWDGAHWHEVGGGVRFIYPGGGSTIHVAALAMDQRGLYVGGNFNSVGGTPITNASNIARWEGTNWFTLNGGVDFVVQAIALNGNDLYVAGGWEFPEIAKWNGTNWTQLGSGLSDSHGVYALARRGADLFVGGAFARAGGEPAENLAIWHIPQSLEIALRSGNVNISWPAEAFDYVLESAPTVPSNNWTQVERTPQEVNGRFLVSEDSGASSCFFRLRHP